MHSTSRLRVKKVDDETEICSEGKGGGRGGRLEREEKRDIFAACRGRILIFIEEIISFEYVKRYYLLNKY